ncbi:MAG: 3-phenylpropionate/trans-cinnamate dioxygenase ferredoxin reductase component [Gammaproteobacteria bacterium]|nr:3-phenylpropionate/trans-cinnamate dioxygenase ferredoxin reductase component [Gammaproteobacteria bacterium]
MSESCGQDLDAAVVIVGSGQAGGRAAEALRLGGHAGPITMIGDESHPPYERPALSKGFLNDASLEQIAWVRPSAWYTQSGITLLRGRKAACIDPAHGAVELDDRSSIAYQTLILTTGTRARPLVLEGSDHPKLSYLRTIEDSQRLQRSLLPGAHIVVIGAGFIGMEVAAAALSRGCAVTVLELADLPMARGIPPLLGSFYADLHRERGADLRTSTRVRRITDANGRALVHTDNGDEFLADAVVVGIGVIPNVDLAQDAGLDIENGIVVDEYGRTSDSRIYAAGDVTSHFNPLLGHRVRLESWQNAQNQAIAVARNILGAAKPYAEVPWFWSDQFDLNLQIAGIPQAGDEVVQRGILGRGPVVFFHLRDGKLAAAIGINSARDVRFGKEIIAVGGNASAAELADASISLAGICGALKRAAKAA